MRDCAHGVEGASELHLEGEIRFETIVGNVKMAITRAGNQENPDAT